MIKEEMIERLSNKKSILLNYLPSLNGIIAANPSENIILDICLLINRLSCEKKNNYNDDKTIYNEEYPSSVLNLLGNKLNILILNNPGAFNYFDDFPLLINASILNKNVDSVLNNKKLTVELSTHIDCIDIYEIEKHRENIEYYKTRWNKSKIKCFDRLNAKKYPHICKISDSSYLALLIENDREKKSFLFDKTNSLSDLVDQFYNDDNRNNTLRQINLQIIVEIKKRGYAEKNLKCLYKVIDELNNEKIEFLLNSIKDYENRFKYTL